MVRHAAHCSLEHVTRCTGNDENQTIYKENRNRSAIRITSTATDCAEQRKRIGGAEGDRTLDLRDANATLSQLSYRPN